MQQSEPEAPLRRLSHQAKLLLQEAVCEKAKDFDRKLIGELPAVIDEIKNFLSNRHVRKAPEWGETFNAPTGPPRGVLARLARRFSTDMHLRRGCWNFQSMASFQREISRFEAWYKPGRRQGDVLRRVRRSASTEQPGQKTIWNKKVALHYRRPRHPVRQEGLWRWRMVAMAIRAAGLPMQTGTIAVERLWASMLDTFPKSARTMRKEWWQLLADLFFMRYNYRHFNHSSLPGWCEGDALLAERIDNLVAMTRQLHQDSAVDSVEMQALVQAFRQ